MSLLFSIEHISSLTSDIWGNVIPIQLFDLKWNWKPLQNIQFSVMYVVVYIRCGQTSNTSYFCFWILKDWRFSIFNISYYCKKQRQMIPSLIIQTLNFLNTILSFPAGNNLTSYFFYNRCPKDISFFLNIKITLKSVCT